MQINIQSYIYICHIYGIYVIYHYGTLTNIFKISSEKSCQKIYGVSCQFEIERHYRKIESGSINFIRRLRDW